MNSKTYRNTTSSNKQTPVEAYQFKEEDFPPLTSVSAKKVFDNKPGITFASLANSWNAKYEEEKKLEEEKKKERESLENLRKKYITPLPHFENVRNFIEPEDDNNEVQYNEVFEEDDWVEVRAKKRRRVVKHVEVESEEERPPTPEKKPEETVWNNQEDEDSYWK